MNPAAQAETGQGGALEGAPSMLELMNLSKTFGGQRALDAASLSIAPGEVHGLLGQNGSGKSTLIKVLAGFHAPDPGGELTIQGRSTPLPLPPGAARRLGLSFVHQHLGLIPSLTVLDNMMLGRLSQDRRVLIGWGAERRRCEAALQQYGVEIRIDAAVASLQPVERALLADEPRVTWNDCPEDIQRIEIGHYRALLIHGDEFGRNCHRIGALQTFVGGFHNLHGILKPSKTLRPVGET